MADLRSNLLLVRSVVDKLIVRHFALNTEDIDYNLTLGSYGFDFQTIRHFGKSLEVELNKSSRIRHSISLEAPFLESSLTRPLSRFTVDVAIMLTELEGAARPSSTTVEMPAPDPDHTVLYKIDNGTRSLQPAEDNQTVAMLFATARKPSSNDISIFDDTRAKEMSFGAIKVRIPEKRKIGSIPRPWHLHLLGWTIYKQDEDDRHFVIKARTRYSRDEFVNAIGQSGKIEALVFVHGFNTTFDAACYRLAQIVWDTQFTGLPILFSWPSKGTVLSYLFDRESSEFSRPRFIELIRLLQAHSDISTIHVIAHSMGNQIVTGGLANLDGPPLSKPLAELILAAPDVDRGIFNEYAARINGMSRGTTLYASSADKALRLSYKAAQFPRAGDVPKDAGPLILPNIDTIDVTAVGDELFGLNHNVFASNRNLIDDMGRVINFGNRPPNRRSPQIRSVPEGAITPKYWRYAK